VVVGPAACFQFQEQTATTNIWLENTRRKPTTTREQIR
jgi:hypothetical protein